MTERQLRLYFYRRGPTDPVFFCLNIITGLVLFLAYYPPSAHKHLFAYVFGAGAGALIILAGLCQLFLYLTQRSIAVLRLFYQVQAVLLGMTPIAAMIHYGVVDVFNPAYFYNYLGYFCLTWHSLTRVWQINGLEKVQDILEHGSREEQNNTGGANGL